MTLAYAPPRGLGDKISRRVTQWRAAAPAYVALERPILSVTFDDFPASAAHLGAPVLEAHGARGTFYAAAGLCGGEGPSGAYFSAEDMLRLAAMGHEIGCHSHSHADGARAAPADIAADHARNAAALQALGLQTPLETAAYPYGETRFAVKQMLAARFKAGRGVLGGINAGRVDRMQLRAFSLFSQEDIAPLRPPLEAAARANGWLIVFTHDIAVRPSPYGATPRALDALLTEARRRGFAIAPLAQAARAAFEACP